MCLLENHHLGTTLVFIVGTVEYGLNGFQRKNFHLWKDLSEKRRIEVRKKFELTSESIMKFGRTLYRIRALVAFGGVKEGELGGFLEKEENLSQGGNAWVSENATVCGNATV